MVFRKDRRHTGITDQLEGFLSSWAEGPIEYPAKAFIGMVKNPDRMIYTDNQQEAARAIRKKLKYGDVKQKLRTLDLLDYLIMHGERFNMLFNDAKLLDRLLKIALHVRNDDGLTFDPPVVQRAHDYMIDWYHFIEDKHWENIPTYKGLLKMGKRVEEKSKNSKTNDGRRFDDEFDSISASNRNSYGNNASYRDDYSRNTNNDYSIDSRYNKKKKNDTYRDDDNGYYYDDRSSKDKNYRKNSFEGGYSSGRDNYDRYGSTRQDDYRYDQDRYGEKTVPSVLNSSDRSREAGRDYYNQQQRNGFGSNNSVGLGSGNSYYQNERGTSKNAHPYDEEYTAMNNRKMRERYEEREAENDSYYGNNNNRYPSNNSSRPSRIPSNNSNGSRRVDSQKISKMLSDATRTASDLNRSLDQVYGNRLSSDYPECRQNYDNARSLRKRILRYLQNVSDERYLGGLIHANDQLVGALKHYDEKNGNSRYDDDYENRNYNNYNNEIEADAAYLDDGYEYRRHERTSNDDRFEAAANNPFSSYA